VTLVDKTLFEVFEKYIVFRYGTDTSCDWIKVFVDFPHMKIVSGQHIFVVISHLKMYRDVLSNNQMFLQ